MTPYEEWLKSNAELDGVAPGNYAEPPLTPYKHDSMQASLVPTYDWNGQGPGLSWIQMLNERQHAPSNSHTIQFTEANTDWKQIAEFRAYALDAANAEIDRLRNDVARLVEAAKPKVVTLPTKGELLAKAVRVEADSYWTGA